MDINQKTKNFVYSFYRSRHNWDREGFKNVVIYGLHNLIGQYQQKNNYPLIMLPIINNPLDVIKTARRLIKK